MQAWRLKKATPAYRTDEVKLALKILEVDDNGIDIKSILEKMVGIGERDTRPLHRLQAIAQLPPDSPSNLTRFAPGVSFCFLYKHCNESARIA